MEERLVVVSGPARGGKSRWAEHLAGASGLPVVYLATGPLLGASAQQPSETTILDLVIDAEAEKNVFWKYPVAVVVLNKLF